MTERPIIGLSSATANQPNTSDEFSFWLAPGVIVNPFDIVEAEQVAPAGTSRTFGIVTILDHSTDAPTHLSNFISNDFGQVGAEPNTVRQGTTVAHVAVLSNDQDIYMPVMNDRPVRFADEAGIHTALGIDQIPARFRVPAGLIQMSNGNSSGGLPGWPLHVGTRGSSCQHHRYLRVGNEDILCHLPHTVHSSESGEPRSHWGNHSERQARRFAHH